jgi:hypothetical protein
MARAEVGDGPLDRAAAADGDLTHGPVRHAGQPVGDRVDGELCQESHARECKAGPVSTDPSRTLMSPR